MGKEIVLKFLNELIKNKRLMNDFGMEDCNYLVKEHEIECISLSSSVVKQVILVKEVLNILDDYLFNIDINSERFVKIIDSNFLNKLIMNKMGSIYKFWGKFIKNKNMLGLRM